MHSLCNCFLLQLLKCMCKEYMPTTNQEMLAKYVLIPHYVHNITFSSFYVFVDIYKPNYISTYIPVREIIV